MGVVLGTGTAFPEHAVPQAELARRVGAWLEGRGKSPQRILSVFENAGVEERRSALPLDELFTPRGFGARSADYARHAVDLAEEAARAALAEAGLATEEVALVTSVSCTGFLLPSIDAHLVNRLGLQEEVRRLPLTLLGCAGGAMGLSHTVDLLAARPETAALLVAVELPSHDFQLEDFSMAHLVSTALFGDGAVALIVGGSARPVPRGAAARPHVVATRTRFFPGTLGTMGFDVRDSGFHMVLDAKIPEFVGEVIWPEIERFLADTGTGVAGVDHFLVHPGGRAILDVLEERLQRGPEALALSRRVLREHGNLSSASVLMLLHEFERTVGGRPGERGLLVAFGPGFNAELIALEWSA